jgi:cAMP-dependent protein kinase regulator
VQPELLHQHPLLQRLTLQQVQRFARVGELELFHPGEDIVVEGTLGDSFYLLLSGVATVHSAKVSQPLATLRMGEFFGEMSLLEPVVRSATVRAAELCEVFRVAHFNLANLLGDDSGALNLVLAGIVRSLSERLRRTNELVGQMERVSGVMGGSLV